MKPVDKRFLYKTAYSRMYKEHVSISKVRQDSLGVYIFDCYVLSESKTIMFSESELQNFCL